jgi:hypothetical protein
MRKRTNPIPLLHPHKVSVADFQAVSGLGRNEVYDQVNAGNIPAVRLGRRILIDYQGGIDWLNTLPSAAKVNPTT